MTDTVKDKVVGDDEIQWQSFPVEAKDWLDVARIMEEMNALITRQIFADFAALAPVDDD